jgi:hypothetical protein
MPAIPADERVSHALQLFDSVLWAFQGTTRTRWTVTAPEAAQVLVVHEDDRDERIGAWRAQGKLVVVIATDSQRDHVQPIALLYPFRAAQVLSLLEHLDAQLGRGEQEDSHGTERLATQEPDCWSLVDALVTFRAVENDQAWLVAQDARSPILWIRGDSGAYVADSIAVQALRDGSLHLNRLLLRKSSAPAPELARRSGMELSWFAGFHASNGLSPHLRPDVRYRIRRWPNFGLIRPQPAQLRLAAGLSSRPASLNELIRQRAVSRDTGIRTFNALYCCGLLDRAQAPAPPRVPPAAAPEAPSRPGLTRLLDSMRRHLGLFGERS